MEDYEGGAIDQSPYPSLRSGYLFSGNGTNADYEGRLRMLKIQNAIDEEQAKSDKLYDAAHPDPLDLAIIGRQKANTYEQSLPVGSRSRMRVDIPDAGTARTQRGDTIEHAVRSDPDMASWSAGGSDAAIEKPHAATDYAGPYRSGFGPYRGSGELPLGDSRGFAIDKSALLGGLTTGEANKLAIDKSLHDIPIKVAETQAAGKIAENRDPVSSADALIERKAALEKRRNILDAAAGSVPPELAARIRETSQALQQEIETTQQKLEFLKDATTKKPAAIDFSGGGSTVTGQVR